MSVESPPLPLKCFDYFVTVKLLPGEQGQQAKPVTTLQFPDGDPSKNFKQLLTQVPLFCFPDSFSFPRKHMNRF